MAPDEARGDSSAMDYSFGNWIKRRRKALDLTQQELARRVGCSVASIVKIEADNRRPSRQIAELLAQQLEIPPEQRSLFIKVARRERVVDILVPAIPETSLSPPPEPRPTKIKLPLAPTPLVGREHELIAVANRLQDPHCRLLTLTGLGGVGKSRLALEAADHLQETFVDGVFFVPLVGIGSPEFLPTAIADALGFTLSGPCNPQTQIISYLCDRDALLVLDNFEHLLAGVDLLADILQNTQQIKFLVTSREQLSIQAEWVFEVQGLPVPASDQELAVETVSSVRMFMQRAQQARFGFALAETDRPAVVRICQLVEGLPLGIELAATWVRTLSLDEIVHEIESGLDFLVSTNRDLPDRHRSLKALLDHSWKLLSQEEQNAWIRLSVFRGGFTRRAGEQVAGATLTLLSSLVAKSLVYRTAQGNYNLHELVREYAYSRLQAQPEVLATTLDSHSNYFIDLVVLREELMKSNQQPAVLAELGMEIDNLRAAFNWAILQGEGARLRQISFSLLYFYELRNWFEEGEQFFRRAAEGLHDSIAGSRGDEIEQQIAYYDMRTNQGYFAYRLGRSEEAEELLQTSISGLRSCGDRLALRFAFRYYGLAHLRAGRYGEGEACLKDSLAMSLHQGHPWEVAITNIYLGILLCERGAISESQAHFEEGLAIGRRLGDTRILAFSLAHSCRTLLALGQVEKARAYLRESLEQSRLMEDRYGIGLALEYLGLVAEHAGKIAEARDWMEQSLEYFTEIRDSINTARSLIYLGYLNLDSGDTHTAREQLYQAIRIVADGNATTEMLFAVGGFAALQARNGAYRHALDWVNCILQHPSCNWTTRKRVEKLYAELRSHLEHGEIEPERLEGQAPSLEDILHEILISAD